MSTYHKHVFFFQLEPHIKEAHIGLVHHMIVYGYVGDVPDHALQLQWDIVSEDMPDDYNEN